MTDLEIKEAVRKRDGYKCQDCGMTQEEHQETVGTVLEVHRLLPGSDYSEWSCVTLCRTCHDKKPSRLTHAIYGCAAAEKAIEANKSDLAGYLKANGIILLQLSHYSAEHRAFVQKITSAAMVEGRCAIDVLNEALSQMIASYKPAAQVLAFPSRLEFDAVDADQAYQTTGA